MIIDAMLLSMAKIASDASSSSKVAIFPEMRLTPPEGIQVTNPESGYELWLTGAVDYAIIQYPDTWERKGMVTVYSSE